METEGKKMFNYKEAEAKKKKFLRYKEGCEIYSMGITKFQEIAKLAGAVYKINQMVLMLGLKFSETHISIFPTLSDIDVL